MIVKQTYKLQVKHALLTKTVDQVANLFGMTRHNIISIALEEHEQDNLIFNKQGE